MAATTPRSESATTTAPGPADDLTDATATLRGVRAELAELRSRLVS